MIHPDDLRYFIEAAQSKNFSRASERLGIRQPTLTMAIQRLEQELQSSLFHRSKKGVWLTKAGEKLYAEAKYLEDAWERVRYSVKSSTTEVKGHYTLGAHPSVALYSLPQSLPKLLDQFPELNISLVHDLSRKITDGIIRGDIDLGIVVNPVRHPDLIIRPLAKDEVHFWCTANANKETLLCEPDLLQTKALLQKAKTLRFTRTVPSASLEIVAALASEGMGVAILPGKVAERWKGLKVLENSPSLVDEIALIYRAESKNLNALKALVHGIEAGMLGNHAPRAGRNSDRS